MGTDVDVTVDGHVVGLVALPIVEVRTIEKQCETFLLLLSRELGNLLGGGIRVVDNLWQDGIHLVDGIAGTGICGMGLEHVACREQHIAYVSTPLERLVLIDEVGHGIGGGKFVLFLIHK